jgi:hypothetical protein
MKNHFIDVREWHWGREDAFEPSETVPQLLQSSEKGALRKEDSELNYQE